MLWIGARTTVNPFAVQELADALAGTGVPVMVKNPVNPDVALWAGALERLERAGITDLAAIHRGFSTFAPSTLPQRAHLDAAHRAENALSRTCRSSATPATLAAGATCCCPSPKRPWTWTTTG